MFVIKELWALYKDKIVNIKIDTRAAVNYNKVLLVSSTYATRFGRADHPLALKYKTLIYFEFMRSHKLYRSL
jgi:hypothetical protein